MFGVQEATAEHEALFICSQRTGSRLDAVRRDQDSIGSKQRRDLRHVGLELVEGAGQGCVLIAWVFQFENTQRQAIDEQHHVRAAIVSLLNDRDLIHCQPVIVIEPVATAEIDQANPVSAHIAVVVEFDGHALDQVLMKPPGLFYQRWRFAC